jgi:hypothetical protein
LPFSGELLTNGDDDGAKAQTDDSTSFGLSNCSKIASFPIAAKKRNAFLISYMYTKGF